MFSDKQKNIDISKLTLSDPTAIYCYKQSGQFKMMGSVSMGNVFKVIGIMATVMILGTCGLVLVGVGTVANDPDVQDAVNELNKTVEDMNAPPIVTLAEFNQIQTGMTYQQIVAIIGEQGTVMSESSFPDGSGGQLQTIMYDWKNGDFSGMNIIIQNGVLYQKSQFGLK